VYVFFRMSNDHRWMYDGWDVSFRHSKEWFEKTKGFINHAFSMTNKES
jgi:hypothetical protein